VGESGRRIARWPSITWQEFHDAFRAHYIPDGVMTMKLEEFLSLK
jgi:hypothetical protein